MNYKTVWRAKRNWATLIGLVVFMHFNMFGQSRFNAGISAGAVATDVNGMDLRDNDNDFNKLGFTVGGIVHSELTKNIALQFEINFIQKGTLQRPDSLNQGYYALKLNYLEIPVIFTRKLHFNVYRVPVDKFDLELGVSAAKLVNVSYTVDNMNNFLDPSKINSLDVSVLFGVNYHITSQFIFNIRYSNSVVPPIKHEAVISNINFLPYTFNAGNNMVFQFTLKYIFKGFGTAGK